MSNNEKINLMADILKQEYMKIGQLSDSQLKDYVECISIFFTTSDHIVAEGSIKTLYMMTKTK